MKASCRSHKLGGAAALPADAVLGIDHVRVHKRMGLTGALHCLTSAAFVVVFALSASSPVRAQQPATPQQASPQEQP